MSLRIIEGSGNADAFDSLENIADNTRFALERAHYRNGKTLIKKFNEQVLAKNKTGRLYLRRDSIGRKRRLRSSAPGETAANRTGFYRKSADFVVQGPKQLEFGNSAPYAGFLESGTSRMEARPGLRNAIRSSQRDMIRNYAEEIEDAI